MDGKDLINTTTYSDLFNSIGTTSGVGDGSTTFNIPDARTRFIINDGSGASLSDRIPGDSSGDQTHTITESELASHNHLIKVNDPVPVT